MTINFFLLNVYSDLEEAKKYIIEFCEKNNIHIINLYKTQEKILELYDTFKNLSAVGNKIMIVGTKRVASSYVKDFGEMAAADVIKFRN